MRRAAILSIALVGCGFEGRGSTQNPGPDGQEVVLDSSITFAEGAELVDSYIAGAGGTLGPGTVEPVFWVPGRLLVEIDDRTGPFDGTWAIKPTNPTDFVNRSLMTASLPNQVPPGASGTDYILWFSGQILLNQGSQRISLAAATNAMAFAEILDGNTLLARCLPTDPACAVDGKRSGWHTLRIGLRRPPAASSHAFELRWANGATDPLTAVPTSRLRVLAHPEALAGWRVDMFARQRGMEPVLNAAALYSPDPFAVSWSPTLLGGQSGSPHYRTAGQLRVAEDGTYDFSLDAERATSVRLWVDGEWLNTQGRFDPTVTNPARELITRELTAGWHDVMIEGYSEGGLTGGATFGFGKTGGGTLPPARADLRPMLGLGPVVTEGASLNAVPLLAGVPVSRTANIIGLSPSPKVIAADVSFRIKAARWQGLTATLISPTNVRAPLSFQSFVLVDNQEAVLHASVPAAQLGGAIDVQGQWTLEVTHPIGSVLDATNVLSHFRLALQHRGLAQQSSKDRFVAQTARYGRMIVLEQEHELFGLESSVLEPAGSSVAVHAQVCNDERGASCEAPLTAAELAEARPMAKYVRLIADFTSDGFATPSLRLLRLRYR